MIQGNFVDLPSNDPIRSLAEEETVLPCCYQPAEGAQLVQVTWYKEAPDATKEQIIIAHKTNGQTGQFSMEPLELVALSLKSWSLCIRCHMLNSVSLGISSPIPHCESFLLTIALFH